MSADHSPTTPPPLPLAVGALRRCVHDYRRDAGRLGTLHHLRPALRIALSELCADARARGATAAQVLIALKAAWGELPEVRAMPRLEGQRLLTDVVQVCIEEYYRGAEEVVRQRT